MNRKMLTFFGYHNCDTCRKARKWLDERDIACDFVDITQKPPTRQQLKQLITGAGYELKALFNRSGQQYRQFNMKDRLPAMTEAEALDLLAKNGKLCKRPIVIDPQTHRATVGFAAETFAKIWET